jgi:hypothetical protein
MGHRRSQVVVFWLQKQRVLAGMNVHLWDVAGDIERLVQPAHPVCTDDLANPASRSPVCSSGQPAVTPVITRWS